MKQILGGLEEWMVSMMPTHSMEKLNGTECNRGYALHCKKKRQM